MTNPSKRLLNASQDLGGTNDKEKVQESERRGNV